MRDRPNDEATIEMLQKDPELAAELLKIAIKENTPEELKDTMHLIRAAGYDVSVTAKPKPEPKPRKRTTEVAAKVASQPRARRSAAVATA